MSFQGNGAAMVNTGWIALAVAIIGGMVTLALSRLRRTSAVDLGTVSHQWITEQRLGHRRDMQR